MGLKVHQGGFKLAYSLIKSGGSLCKIESAIDLMIRCETFDINLSRIFGAWLGTRASTTCRRWSCFSNRKFNDNFILNF